MTVKSTQEAIDAITRMQGIINGGLADEIAAFVSDGNSLNPENFAGPRADAFYNEWGNCQTALNKAVEMLRGITDEIQNANADIQVAGGNV